jgi:hypothetical protein
VEEPEAAGAVEVAGAFVEEIGFGALGTLAGILAGCWTLGPEPSEILGCLSFAFGVDGSEERTDEREELLCFFVSSLNDSRLESCFAQPSMSTVCFGADGSMNEWSFPFLAFAMIVPIAVLITESIHE